MENSKKVVGLEMSNKSAVQQVAHISASMRKQLIGEDEVQATVRRFWKGNATERAALMLESIR